MIISDFITALVSKSNAIFDSISSDEIRSYLNDAIVLHRTYIRNRVPSEYNKSSSISFVTDSNEVALPSDVDTSCTALLRTSKYAHNPVSSLEYTIDRGNVIFYEEQPSGQEYYIEYTAVPNSYSANTDDCVELDYPDVKLLLEAEIRKYAIKVEDDFDSSNAVNNLTEEANNAQRT